MDNYVFNNDLNNDLPVYFYGVLLLFVLFFETGVASVSQIVGIQAHVALFKFYILLNFLNYSVLYLQYMYCAIVPRTSKGFV